MKGIRRYCICVGGKVKCPYCININGNNENKMKEDKGE